MKQKEQEPKASPITQFNYERRYKNKKENRSYPIQYAIVMCALVYFIALILMACSISPFWAVLVFFVMGIPLLVIHLFQKNPRRLCVIYDILSFSLVAFAGIGGQTYLVLSNDNAWYVVYVMAVFATFSLFFYYGIRKNVRTGYYEDDARKKEVSPSYIVLGSIALFLSRLVCSLLGENEVFRWILALAPWAVTMMILGVCIHVQVYIGAKRAGLLD